MPIFDNLCVIQKPGYNSCRNLRGIRADFVKIYMVFASLGADFNAMYMVFASLGADFVQFA